MSAPNVANYLAEQKKTADKDVAAEWIQMEEYYNEK